MLTKIIAYFVDRHLLTNLLFAAVLIGGMISWQEIKKEEMPDVTFDRVRISASYPGATAAEVEHFVTKEIEDAVSGLDGVYRVISTASQGSTSITVELEQDYPRRDEAITEIRNAVLDVTLPDDVLDDPEVRVFETSKKAIIDLALVPTDTHLMSVEQRERLQQYALTLEHQLINLPQVNSLGRSGYRQEEIQIKVDPAQLVRYSIPLSQVRDEISRNHIRQPAGHIEVKDEPRVTISAQLDTPGKLDTLAIQAGFEGQAIPLKDIANVRHGYRDEHEIIKINGHQAILLNVVKSSSYGILDALAAVRQVTNRFRETHLKNIPIDLVLLDDESMDVRNRLKIISQNGMIGFFLILFILFLFLNKRSGVWVAMGIPFTISLTLIASVGLGYTINNTTLAAVIIVMGIVVDDAIVVAEHVARLRSQGYNSREASVEGTTRMFLPILASITTTCVAFIPLFFFSGRFGQFAGFIPPIIFLMLGASLFEALVILPGHLRLDGFALTRKRTLSQESRANTRARHWFEDVEDRYGQFLEKWLPAKYWILAGFVVMLIIAFGVMTRTMKYVMFPSEETQDIVFIGTAAKNADRFETAEITRQIESIIAPYIGQEVVGLRTEIARSRRGGAVEENKFRTIVEIVPKEQRRKTADQLIKAWEAQTASIAGLTKLVLQKNRWGQSSGSAIEVLIQENDDTLRAQAAAMIAQRMKNMAALEHVEIDEPIRIPEYQIDLQREKLKRLSINPQSVASAFRCALEGLVLYEFPKGEEAVNVRLSIQDEAKQNIETVLDVPVENSRDYLVPLRDVVRVTETTTPNSISRQDGRRTTLVYADLKDKTDLTPLEVAEDLEQTVFRDVTNAQPSTTLSFSGEIYDTRESGRDFQNAILLVILLIFAILAVLYNSLTKPLVIMLAIPFGMVGVILAFLLHGKILFGFFAAVGALGLAGVVINDSIIMLAKLDEAEQEFGTHRLADAQIARTAQTRLRAVVLTTLTTVAGVLPTAYGFAGYDAMLAEMMLALAWGLAFGTLITLLLVPCLYSILRDLRTGALQLFNRLGG